jgi:hypothetical protein
MLKIQPLRNAADFSGIIRTVICDAEAINAGGIMLERLLGHQRVTSIEHLPGVPAYETQKLTAIVQPRDNKSLTCHIALGTASVCFVITATESPDNVIDELIKPIAKMPGSQMMVHTLCRKCAASNGAAAA